MADDRFSMGLFDPRIKDQRRQVFKVRSALRLLLAQRALASSPTSRKC